MRSCLIGFAAMLMIEAPALGQADKFDPSRAAPDGQHHRALVLASADAPRPAAAAPQQPALPRKRVEPRITTCRCGDSQTQSDPDTQEQ